VRGAQWLRARRYIDAFIVVLAAPVLIPVAAVAMAAVFLEDRESPLIGLRRVGVDGTALDIFKIRSMSKVQGVAITASGDHRITRVGRVLRSWRIDEIPQTWLILQGRMALIGPRPEAPEFVDSTNSDWQKVLGGRPAIAGLTQIVASPWEERELVGEDALTTYRSVAVPAKLAIDAWYIDNASPSLDWAIVKSLFQMFLRRALVTPAHSIIRDEVPGAAVLLESSDRTQRDD
jgi:lipopolysaccharide/colanic/teichoic acid biosynthesis glycosyltransferase